MKRLTLLLCAIFVVGCDDSSSSEDAGISTDAVQTGDAVVGKDGEPPSCNAVTISFNGEVATVAGTPLGLDSTARTSPVSGSFSYSPCAADTRPTDPQRGEYDHGAGGDFTFAVSGLTVTGSGHPLVKVEDLNPDTFRYLDGPQILDKDKAWRQMSLDGTPNPDLKVSLSITDGTGAAFSSDALPKAFPMLAIGSYTHTFSVRDGGGTLLMQLTSLTQK